ncbi:MAG TPA: hypothetical protein VGO86_01995, partial [Candidatus Dormibacteraeota bacterium]
MPALAVIGVLVTASTIASAEGCGTWVRLSADDPGSFSDLSGLAIVSPTDIWTIGGGGFQHSAGGGFALVAAPLLGALRGGPRAISADAWNDVWAVGQRAPAQSYPPTSTLVEHFDGSSWAVVASPSPDARSNSLSGVVALAPNNVWAVGQSANRALIEHFDGSSWSVASNPAPGGRSQLYAVAAAAPTSVKAVGYFIDPGGVLRPLVLSYDGSAWSRDATPASGANLPAPLIAITHVPSSTHYIATGGSTAQSILRYDGAAWSSQPGAGTPFRGDVQEEGSVYSVDAISDADVWLVGAYYGSASMLYALQPFALHSGGSGWTSTFSTFSVSSGASALETVGHAGTAMYVTGYYSPTPSSYGQV